MTGLTGRLRREAETMTAMVELYCSAHHETTETPCADCSVFLAYATKRLEKCPYGQAKPTCARCPIHCYKPGPRGLAREIMRRAGPRMMRRHPWLTITHVLDKLRRAEHPMAIRRRRGAPPGA